MLTFQHGCEQPAPSLTRKEAVLAADEVFFGELLILGIDGFVLRLFAARIHPG